MRKSPQITDCRWGRVSIDGHGTVKDAKLYPGGARAWDWRETGTRHDPGIQPADVVELLEHGAEAVVLSRGVLRMLKVCPETLALLQEGNTGACPADGRGGHHLQSAARNGACRRADPLHPLTTAEQAMGDGTPPVVSPLA